VVSRVWAGIHGGGGGGPAVDADGTRRVWFDHELD
jgi:hypothetical protein